MEEEGKSGFTRWKEEHETAWQFILFNLVGLIVTAVDLTIFSLLNFWLLIPMRETPFTWWIIDYSVENGGMTAFLSFAISFVLSQILNFFVQRKTTFKANNNALKSGIMFAVMIVFIYFLQLYIPTLIRSPIVLAAGAALGDLIVKVINMLVSLCIQFPMNKWVIMRKS